MGGETYSRPVGKASSSNFYSATPPNKRRYIPLRRSGSLRSRFLGDLRDSMVNAINDAVYVSEKLMDRLPDKSMIKKWVKPGVIRMGGGSYSRDVGTSSSSGSFYSGGTSSVASKSALGRSYADRSTSPKRKIVTSNKLSPIVIALDVTGSNIEFARIVYDKAPMLHGQIEQQGYLKDFDICFSAIGDAYCDDAPLQVCDFQYGLALDDELKKLWLEGHGGGQRMETYELGAHYFSKKCKMPKADMPFMFFIGDEAPYPKLTSGIVSDVMGNTIANDYASKKVFQGLFKKFQDNVFFLQNPYCGNRTRDTEEIKEEWINIVGREYAEHIIPITEEKSVIDVILGTIAMVSNTRDMRQYMGDMEQRGQTSRRRRNVEQSLGGLEAVVAAKAGKKKSGAKRL